MSNLKHMFFPVTYECKTKEKLKLDGARKLEVIENFHAFICDVDDLIQFMNLKILKVISDGENMESYKLINSVQEINESRSLNKLSLVLKDFDCYSSERQYTFKQLAACRGIHDLYLEGCIRRMPRNLKYSQDFTDIFLDGTELREDPMPELGKLANLKSLVLSNDNDWVREEESMPNLMVLRIKLCNNLETFPEDLMEIPTLVQLKIGSMPKEFHEIVCVKAEQQKDMENFISIEYES